MQFKIIILSWHIVKRFGRELILNLAVWRYLPLIILFSYLYLQYNTSGSPILNCQILILRMTVAIQAFGTVTVAYTRVDTSRTTLINWRNLYWRIRIKHLKIVNLVEKLHNYLQSQDAYIAISPPTIKYVIMYVVKSVKFNR